MAFLLDVRNVALNVIFLRLGLKGDSLGWLHFIVGRDARVDGEEGCETCPGELEFKSQKLEICSSFSLQVCM
jgi:hypothetical protein